MADSPYGVYVSFRLPSGELFSSNRETADEVRADLKAILGDEEGGSFFERFSNRPAAVVASTPSPAPATVATPAPASVGPTADDLPADGFETCEKCGSLKDVWKQGGISQAGKPYPGFFSCPNWVTHK